MANRYELINLANATHNQANPPEGWKVIADPKTGLEFKTFGPITTQLYEGPDNQIVLTIKGSDEFADWVPGVGANPAFVNGQPTSLPSFSLLAQRKRSKRNGTPMSADGFSKAFLLGEGQLTKVNLAQTVPHLYRSNTHKISSPPIGGKECSLKVA